MSARGPFLGAAGVAAVAAFVGPALLLERSGVADSGRWVTGRAFAFYSAKLARTITVPAGFKTDLASVPRLPVMYWLYGATADEAAVVHDWLYTVQDVKREEADAVFVEAMEVIHQLKAEEAAAEGVPVWKRTVQAWMDKSRRGAMWVGVRIGGGAHWKADNLPQEPHVQAAIDAGSTGTATAGYPAA